ncbi:MAG TPA: tetratricopeptide repeat protein [Pyrinomonadaceae bacterium]|nr:tetratricopeptide repeat protein [Pyrinomonadaceae bacterium]
MLKISRLTACVLLCLAFAAVAPLPAQSTKSVAASLTAAEAEKWREDLRVLATEMPLRHRNLFHTVKREEFEAAVKSLNERIPQLTRNQVIVEFIRIVAMVKDGHTGVAGMLWDPKIGFRSYPLSLYFFKDGLFVLTAAPEHAAAVGARVVKIGNKSAEQVYDSIKGLIFHDRDNEFGLKASAPFAMVIPEVLQALGIVEDMDKAQFVLEKDGKQMTVEVSPVVRVKAAVHNTWDFVKPAGWADARDAAAAPVPLWLKNVNNLFWYEYLADSKTVYVQFNGVSDKPEETFAAFTKRLFDFVEKNEVERFVLDLRWNGGGNNYLNRPLIVGLIKSKVDERGKLFTIISRHTFSAAQNLVNELEKYTNTIFVGEPTGENVNFYGDSARIELPNSGLVVRASTLWWQNLDPRDRRQWTGPHIAAELTSTDYLTNNDPAMKAILGYTPKGELTAQLMEALDANDVALAAKRFREYVRDPANAYQNAEAAVNSFGYRLMGMNRLDHAIEIFKLNTEAYPKSSNVWDSLGEAYMNKGNKELAIKNYEKSLELDPSNANAVQMLKKLRGM